MEDLRKKFELYSNFGMKILYLTITFVPGGLITSILLKLYYNFPDDLSFLIYIFFALTSFIVLLLIARYFFCYAKKWDKDIGEMDKIKRIITDSIKEQLDININRQIQAQAKKQTAPLIEILENLLLIINQIIEKDYSEVEEIKKDLIVIKTLIKATGLSVMSPKKLRDDYWNEIINSFKN